MTEVIEGRVVEVLVGREAKSLVSTAQAEVAVSLEGFEGDKHAGYTMRSNARQPHFPRGTLLHNSRQVSLVSVEELAEIAARLGLPRLEAAWLGANLCLTDLPHLTDLPPGTRLFFPQEAVLVVEGENTPCRGPGKIIQEHYPDRPKLTTAFPKAALRRRGLVGWVERAGIIRADDRVKIVLPPPVVYAFP